MSMSVRHMSTASLPFGLGSIVAIEKPTPTRRRVRSFAFDPKSPPREIQLWLAGDNPTDYGVHKWTERSAAEVMAVYNDRGNPLLIDIEHNAAMLEGGEPAETGGYAVLELRSGEPWLRFDWSAVGVEQIATGQRRFLSPEYDVDPTTNEIVRLYRVSLVADPATHSARILASANKENNIVDPKLAAILAILEGVSDPAEAIASIKNAISSIEPSADVAPTVDTPVTDPTPAFASADGDGDDKDEDKEKKVVVATAPAAPAAVAAAAPPASVPAVTPAKASAEESGSVKAARDAAKRSEDALRDNLIVMHGHRLQTSIRTWASTQPLAVVRGLIAAAPEALPAPSHVTATRGAGHGTGANGGGLQGAELEEFQKRMGTFKASASKLPYRNEAGDLVLPATPPREVARVLAAQAKKEGAR